MEPLDPPPMQPSAMVHFMAIQSVLKLHGWEFKPKDFTPKEWRLLIERLEKRSISDVLNAVRNRTFSY